MSARRSRFYVGAALIVAFVMMSGFAVTGAYALVASAEIQNPVVIVKSGGGPNENVVTCTWTCPESGTWHHWIVNSGLKALSIDVYEKTKAKPISVYSSQVIFSAVGAYPSGTVYIQDFAVVKDAVYKFVLTPIGHTGTSAQYFHEFRGMVPPVASFTFSGVGLTITADASGSYDLDGFIVRYDWNWGDGGTGSGQVANHTYAEWMAPTVALTVTDDDGLVNTTSKHFPIWPFIVWGFTYGPDGTPLTECTVVVSSLRTMSYLTTVSDSSAYYQVDFNRISGGWVLGDVIRIAATKGTMSGSTDVVLAENVPFLLVDVTLGLPLPPFIAFGYTYNVMAQPLSGSIVQVSNLRTGGSLSLTSNTDGFFQCDLSVIPGGWYIGDVIRVRATWGMLGEIRDVLLTVENTGGGSIQMDVVLRGGPPPPLYLFGYTYGPDGLPLYGCAVTATDLRTGEHLVVTSDTVGAYIFDDLTMLPGGWMLGDTIRVTAAMGTLSGSADVVIVDVTVPYLQLDVTLH